MRNLQFTLSAIVGSLVLSSAANAATVVYQNDFENGSAANLSGGNVVGTQGFSAHGTDSNFYHNTTENEATVLSLAGLAPHSTVTVTFDVALIDSWDGTNPIWGTDLFNFAADGNVIFSEVAGNSRFTNRLGDESFGLNTNLFGNSIFNDSIYTLSFTFAHTGDTLDLSFFGSGTGVGAGFQGLNDENFAIDNIVVSTDASEVPLPAAAWFMGAGIAAYTASRRKKA